MKRVRAPLGIAILLLAHAGTALADQGHAHGGPVAFGSPGKMAEVARTVEVIASDNMRFTPGSFLIKQGETIRFVVKNAGKTAHEFSIGDRSAHRAHGAMMKSMAGMQHADSETTVLLEPGETKTLVWKFDKRPTSALEFACNLPGHYEAGMKAQVELRR
jgi:uncharacterized cupredoxin-like copper-binding protein